MLFVTGTCAVAFALIHLFIGKLTFLNVLPRSRWLSFAGGIAVSYVFLHILPELSGHQETLAEEIGVSDRAAETWVYLIALLGLGIFYGLERAVKTSRKSSTKDRVESEILWLHIVSFGIYNILIGYLLLHREETGIWSLLIYAIAMLLHFVTNDYGMRQDQKDQYEASGRWAIAGSVLFGWAVGVVASLPRIMISFLFAFLAGGVVLNVLKEELPEERESRFWPFALGVAGYAVLLIVAQHNRVTGGLFLFTDAGRDETRDGATSELKHMLEHGNISMMMLFSFNRQGLIETVRAGRHGRMSGEIISTPCEGRFWNYGERNGMLVPIQGEVAWLLAIGKKPYWHGRITEIAYEFTG